VIPRNPCKEEKRVCLCRFSSLIIDLDALLTFSIIENREYCSNKNKSDRSYLQELQRVERESFGERFEDLWC
jgi:hypothetical protein